MDTISYASGVASNMISDAIIERKDYRFGKALVGSLYSGVPNMVGSLGYCMSTVSTLAGSTTVYKALAVGITASTQAATDGLNYYMPYTLKKITTKYMRMKQNRFLKSQLINDLGW